MSAEPTEAEWEAYKKFLCEHFKVRVVDKDDAWEMQMVGWFLQLIKVQDKQFFLDNYATTIGNSIWIPKKWPLIEKVLVLPHEIMHSLQFRNGGFVPTALRYATQKGRAELEGDCYIGSMEMHYQLFGWARPPAEMAAPLVHYAMDQQHVDYVAAQLATNVPSLPFGITSLVVQVAADWVVQHAPHWRVAA